MVSENSASSENQRARQALILWSIYLTTAILLNGTVPFALGKDMRVWTASPIKDVLTNAIIYSGIFLVVPLILTKKWVTIRQVAFILPLIMAILAMTLRTYIRPVAAISVLILMYLHWRFDLSDLGFRSRGWRGDVIAILLLGVLGATRLVFSREALTFAPGAAFLGMLDRLFANPASTTENLFYFGFLAERLSVRFGKLWTPAIIGLMYTLHEMTNPEYWYEGTFFPMIFIGVTLFAAIYLWRRSVVVIWLGDGLGKFLNTLF